MSTVLVCSSPIHGHVSPMLAATAHLVEAGYDVTVLTGSRFRDRVVETGAAFRPLTGLADFDDRVPDDYIPDRDLYRGVKRAQYEIGRIFVDTIPDQFAAASAAIDAISPDVVVVDGPFIGLGPLVAARRTDRPPVIALGVTPLSQSSRDTAPFGMGLPPATHAVGRLKQRGMGVVASRVLFHDLQRRVEAAFASTTGARVPGLAMDTAHYADRFLQLSTRETEYPRSDIAPSIEFIGPLVPHDVEAPLPEWWHELDATRPVVHVTQGTIDNDDFSRLVQPTIDAFADRDALVVVSLGGRPESSFPHHAPHVRVASFLPYRALLARTDVMVTNGGFGGVSAALLLGVPLVVAGDTEEKPEVAARVAWSGAGIDLRTGRPTAAEVRSAVDALLDPAARERSRGIARAAATYDARASIERVVAEVTR
ncbi:glycosyltransferase [Agromyces atrinae]|uniref:glycosyltransferase n=1 Tax=Agromyces atrinae TaxID=592376 RepID=UPI001F5AAEDF|nr:nucleotide disphospho-sugar-binding domain-containing protein [Agromyces atrinae]MCI2959492.1 glycosyltransferase [Agromyces atrinae]